MEFLYTSNIILFVAFIFVFYQQWELKYFVYTSVLQALNEVKKIAEELKEKYNNGVVVNVNSKDTTNNTTNTNGNDNTMVQNSDTDNINIDKH